MAKKKAKQKVAPRRRMGWLFRSDVIGSALVVLAFLMLLSLISQNRGDVTGALVTGARLGFGVGAWLLPVLLGIFGFWLVARRVGEMPAISGVRLGGGAALFLVLETVLHWVLSAPDSTQALALAGGGGGVVGWLICQAMLVTLGPTAAAGILALIVAAGLLAVSGLTLAEAWERLVGAWHSLRGVAAGPAGLPVNLPLPLGKPEPAWRRWWRSLRRPRPLPSPLTGLKEKLTPSPAPSAPPVAETRPVERVTLPATPKPAGPGRPATMPEPRIIGDRDPGWRLPAIDEILEDSSEHDIQGEDLRRRAEIIERTLEGFGIPVQVVEANQGPAVTQFGLKPGIIVRRNSKGEEKRVKVRVSQIQALANDLALALAASPIRIEAPVPGRDVVGIEVPNVQISMVSLRGVMESEEYRASRGPLAVGLGRDVSGQAAAADMTRMPHLLIAGATGSGKSVCVNAIISALLLTHTPETLRLLMVDPKRVELTVYNGVPHLIAPVVVDVERAVPVLNWATREMDRRYKLFARASVRNVESYNAKLAAQGETILPYIVVVIDELADLMLSAPEEVERHICRIAQMARATGIHLVIATQRPSVDVVTGLIKANFPARIAFAVSSQVDSRVILDTPGAEQLLGRGDMLFMSPDASKLHRLQGCFVSDRETQRLVQYWRGLHTQIAEAVASDSEDDEAEPLAVPGNGHQEQPPWGLDQDVMQQPLWPDLIEEDTTAPGDDMYQQAEEEVRKSGRASISLLQRRLRVGYSRAARLIDELEANGVIGPDQGGSRGREVLSPDE